VKSLRLPGHTWSKSTRLIRSAPLRRAPSPARSRSRGGLASVSAKDCGPPGPATSPGLRRSGRAPMTSKRTWW